MQAEKAAARKGAIEGEMMGKGDKSNLLLTSLEEIKKSSAEEEPVRPAPAAPASPAAPGPSKSGGAGSLLDSLLSDVRQEAEREVEEITRTLQEKTAAERKFQEEEERKKQAQYEKLIQEEARRRQSLIQKREDDKRRKELEERHKEEARQQLLAEAARLKRRRQVLLAASGVGLLVLVAVVVLVATGVIPLGPTPPAEVATNEAKSTVPAVSTGQSKVQKGADAGKMIADTELPPLGDIDGEGGLALGIPEHYDIDSLIKPHPLRVQLLRPQVETQLLRERVARAFVHTSSGGGSVKGDSGSEGGIKIDDSIFDVGADKNKKKKR